MTESSASLSGNNGDLVNLKTNYGGCSNNQTIIEPTRGTNCTDAPNYTVLCSMDSGWQFSRLQIVELGILWKEMIQLVNNMEAMLTSADAVGLATPHAVPAEPVPQKDSTKSVVGEVFEINLNMAAFWKDVWAARGVCKKMRCTSFSKHPILEMCLLSSCFV
jgi:hypothetical protein